MKKYKKQKEKKNKKVNKNLLKQKKSKLIKP